MFKRNTLQESHLFALLQNAKKPELRTIEALVYRLFGRKRLAGQAFRRLLFWMPRSQRKDGAVYKTSKDFSIEIGCAPESIDRAIPLLKDLCFTVFLKKAKGAPTNHYILEEDRLVARLAEIFEASVEQIYKWMKRRPPQKNFAPDAAKSLKAITQDAGNDSSQDAGMNSDDNVGNESDKMPETITGETNNKKSSRKKQKKQNSSSQKAIRLQPPADDPAIVRLRQKQAQSGSEQETYELGDTMKGVTRLRDRIGCTTTVMCKLVTDYGVERVEYVIGKAEIEAKKGTIKNKIAWIVAALKRGYEWNDDAPQKDGNRDQNQQKPDYSGGRYADIIES